jgi:hypothetical protein
MWARKNKNRPVSGFFTKLTHVQVINFIPVKVSTLYIFSLWSDLGPDSPVLAVLTLSAAVRSSTQGGFPCAADNIPPVLLLLTNKVA